MHTRLGAIIALVLTVALAGCTHSPATSDDTPGAATTGGLGGTLQGTGASSMKAAQDVWRAEFQTANPGLTINYSPDGSGAGRTAFAEGAAAFAGSDRALRDNEMTRSFALCAPGASPINLPVYISPIAIVYNLDGVPELNLSAEVIARIFAGQLTRWDDPAITALNPGVDFPDEGISPVHRSDNSGTTENFTETLSQVAPEVWTWEPSGDWPVEIGGEGGDKTQGVIQAVQLGKGMIGYADLSGVPVGMTMANYSLTGEHYTAPTAEAAAQLVAAAERVPGRPANDWALELDRTAAGYPFVLVAYAIACQHYSDVHTAELVNAYLSYVVSAEGQLAAQPMAGNAPLTGELAAGVRAATASIS